MMHGCIWQQSSRGSRATVVAMVLAHAWLGTLGGSRARCALSPRTCYDVCFCRQPRAVLAPAAAVSQRCLCCCLQLPVVLVARPARRLAAALLLCVPRVAAPGLAAQRSDAHAKGPEPAGMRGVCGRGAQKAGCWRAPFLRQVQKQPQKTELASCWCRPCTSAFQAYRARMPALPT